MANALDDVQSQSVDQNQLPTQQPDQSQPTQAQPVSQPQVAPSGQPQAAAPTTPSTPAPDQPQHPLVQHASVLHDIAQALAGGPRYKTTVDVSTGETKRTPMPMDRKDIGMAIALSAITGSLAGMGAKGTNANAQAASLGFNATSQARKDADKQADEQTQADLARHMQITETNFRMHDNALRAGKMSYDQNKEYVDSFKDLYQRLQDTYPNAIKGVVAESDLSKYHVSKDGALPVGIVPRTDSTTGKQMVDSYGIPQWDVDYAIVDPTVAMELSDEDKAVGQKYGLPGYTNSDGQPTNLPTNLQLKLGTILNQKAKIGALKLAEGDVKNFTDTLNRSAAGANVPVWGMFPDLEHLAGFIQDHESGGKEDARNMRNNNPGNLKATSPSQHQDKDGFRIFDSAEEGRLELVNQLQRDMVRMPSASPEQYFEHYSPNSDPGNGPGTSEAYAKAARKASGIAQVDNVDQKFKPIDLAAEVKRDPMLADSLAKFQAIFNRTGSYGQAIDELGKKDQGAATRISQLYGGRSVIDEFDQDKVLEAEQAKDRIKSNEQIRKEALDRQGKEAEKYDTYRSDAKAIAGDPNDPSSGDMLALDKLISQRTADRPLVFNMIKGFNPNWSMADAEAKLGVWKDFTTDKGKASQQVKSANTLFDHIGGALDASDAYRRSGQSDLLNKPLNWWNQHFANDPLLAQYRTAIEPVRSEFMTFLQNNHALTEQDKKTGDILLSDTMTPALMEASLKQFAETAAFRLKENDQQWFRMFRRHFPGMISDDALSAIQKMTDANGNNKTADILKDMDTGGSILGSSNGRGVPGKTVAEALGRPQQPTQQQPNPQGQPQGQPKFAKTFTNGQQQIGWDGKQWVDVKTGQPYQAASAQATPSSGGMK
jgi:hypothetical protein